MNKRYSHLIYTYTYDVSKLKHEQLRNEIEWRLHDEGEYALALFVFISFGSIPFMTVNIIFNFSFLVEYFGYFTEEFLIVAVSVLMVRLYRKLESAVLLLRCRIRTVPTARR